MREGGGCQAAGGGGMIFVGGSNTGGWTYNSGTNTLSGSVNLGAASFTWSEENRSGYQAWPPRAFAGRPDRTQPRYWLLPARRWTSITWASTTLTW